MDERFIQDFADRLVPEAFTRSHSAFRVERADPVVAGADGFDDWVRERLLVALRERYPDGTRPWLYVEVDDQTSIRWRWDIGTCEEVEWFVDRVRGEARDLAGPWLFTALIPGPPRGDRVWSLPWYAEARGRGVADVRTGALDLVGDEIVASYALDRGEALPRLGHRLLHAHPARRELPLRRRRSR